MQQPKLIDIEKRIKEWRELCASRFPNMPCQTYEQFFRNAPAVDAEPVRHGRWVKCQGKSNIWYCSECGEKINYKQNRRTYNIPKVQVWQKNKRCRNCGAKMDGGAEDG